MCWLENISRPEKVVKWSRSIAERSKQTFKKLTVNILLIFFRNLDTSEQLFWFLPPSEFGLGNFTDSVNRNILLGIFLSIAIPPKVINYFNKKCEKIIKKLPWTMLDYVEKNYIQNQLPRGFFFPLPHFSWFVNFLLPIACLFCFFLAPTKKKK